MADSRPYHPPVQRRLAILAVCLALSSLVGAAWISWPRILLQWHGWKIRKASEEQRFYHLIWFYEHPHELFGMSMDAFVDLIGPPVWNGCGGIRYQFGKPKETYDALVLDESLSGTCHYFGVFVEDRLVHLGCWGPSPREMEAVEQALAMKEVVDDYSLTECIPDVRLEQEKAERMLPALVAYLRRCPDPRSRDLCCYVLHEITKEDLPPDPGAWATWWDKRKATAAAGE